MMFSFFTKFFSNHAIWNFILCHKNVIGSSTAILFHLGMHLPAIFLITLASVISLHKNKTYLLGNKHIHTCHLSANFRLRSVWPKRTFEFYEIKVIIIMISRSVCGFWSLNTVFSSPGWIFLFCRFWAEAFSD